MDACRRGQYFGFRRYSYGNERSVRYGVVFRLFGGNGARQQTVYTSFAKIAECDFSVRIKDSSVFANFGIAQNFNNMAEQLESVETLRENFISDFSHEFKTPIVSIAGFAKLLKDPTLTAEQRNEYLDVIIDESDRLVGLSESVLMLNRLDSQVIVKEEYCLTEQIRQCVLMFDRQCQDKNINLDMELEETQINSNAKLLSQVWVNLMSNAVKFTPDGGTIYR